MDHFYVDSRVQVFDTNGEVVGWMEAWYDDNASSTTCGVKILEKLPVHDDIFGGSFEVRIELDLPATMPPLFSHVNLHILSAKLHMREELITRISGILQIFSICFYIPVQAVRIYSLEIIL